MRFIGSKVLLLEQIENIIKMKADGAQTFCDIFSGTSIVARYFKKDFQIISNDLLHFSYVLQKATIENEGYPKFKKIKEYIGKDPFDYFKSIEFNKDLLLGRPFIYENYSPNENSHRQYFSNDNALKIDLIRQMVEE